MTSKDTESSNNGATEGLDELSQTFDATMRDAVSTITQEFQRHWVDGDGLKEIGKGLTTTACLELFMVKLFQAHVQNMNTLAKMGSASAEYISALEAELKSLRGTAA